MSENKNKTPLEEALNNFEEIKKFAQEQAAQALESKVEETLKEFFDKKLNEDTTINIDSTGNVEITTDGEVVSPEEKIAADADSVDLSVDSETELDSEDEFEVSDDEDEIEVSEAEWLPETMITSEENIQNQNMEEINRMMEDEVAPATPAPAAAAPAAEVPAAAPAAEAPAGAETAPAAPATVEDIIPKLDTLINLMMQQVGGAAPEAGAQPGAEAGTDQEFEVIDDEAGAAPAAVPTVPTEEVPANPMEEEIEIVDFEENNFIDEMEEQMLEIDGVEDEPTVDETRGVGFAAIRTGQRNMNMDHMKAQGGHHGPVAIKENKAQNESKLDELAKENSSLKNEIASLKTERKDFETAFSKLRTQFNEMQLFNGKLVLLNKVLKNGGLKQEEKIRVCEQFDSAKTYEDASKLFKNIMKESNVKVENNGLEKLKAAGTNTAKPKSTSESLYESAEAKRNRQLAGIGKSEEEN